MSSPTSVVDVGSAIAPLGVIALNRNTCRPAAVLPSGHGIQSATVCLTYQTPLRWYIGAVQPHSLVTVPVHSPG